MSDIQKTIEAGILSIRLNRPEKRNSLTAAMYLDLAQIFRAAADDPSVRAVVIGGDEAAFSAGNDLGDFVENPPDKPDAPVWQFLGALSRFPKPVIAAVCGVAVGIGTTMLLHCDVVFAGDNARFVLPFADLGICPEAASSLLLPMLAGYQRAARVLLGGQLFDANAAAQMGLVNEILPKSEVHAAALAEAAKLVAKPAISIAQTKRLMKQGMLAQIEAQMRDEAVVFKELITGGAAKEAIAAFSEKRKPDFSRF